MLEEQLLEEETKTVKLSPFCYHKGMKIDTFHHNGSMAEIIRMRQDGTFTEVHRRILDVMARYRYLNAYLVRNALLIEKDSVELSATACKQALKKLYVNGLLNRYSLSYMEGDNEHGSPFVYSATDLGMRLLRSESTVNYVLSSRRDDYFSVSALLGRLAFAQFHIMLWKEFNGKGILKKYGLYTVEKNRLVLPGYYEFRVKNEILPKMPTLCLMVYAVRSDPQWVRTYFHYLRCAAKVAIEKSQLPYCVLVICENEQQAMTAERFRATDAGVSSMDVYYLTDRSILNEEGVLSQLIQVEAKRDFSTYRYFKLDLGGGI